MADVAMARQDGRLSAQIVSRRPLVYASGAQAAEDRPAHVRAGSGLAWIGHRLAIVQDDAAFIALADPRGGPVEAITLPAGPGGRRQFDVERGNKADKLDLEACVSVPERGAITLLGFGSGSMAVREVVVVVRRIESVPEVAVVDARPLYARLHAERSFSGSELNLEGAFVRGDVLTLVQRGNGAPRDGRSPVDATAELSLAAFRAWLEGGDVPALGPIVAWDLGTCEGVRLTFADAAIAPWGPAFLGCAEASPNAVDDGEVVGCVLGSFDGRWARIVAEDGRPSTDKPEGLAFDEDDPTRAWIVLDADDPSRPAELCELALFGPWAG